MKFSHTLRSFFLALVICGSLINSSYAQNIPDLDPGYFLIVGAFKLKDNAVRYSKFINDRGEKSEIGRNPDKNLFYVYVSDSEDLEFIKSKWTEYRLEPEFEKAWVFNNGMEQASEPEDMLADGAQNQTIFEDPAEKPENQAPKINIPEPVAEQDSDSYKYLFNVTNSTTLKEVSGFITVVDNLRNKVVTSVETNTSVEIPDPGTQTKEVIFICDIFGYVKQQTVLKLDEPLASGESNVTVAEDGTTLVNFELARHKAGDIITMYHVYFYNDAAIMKPESQYELNSLLDMLKENENLKIKIHGHSNGNAPGKIIKMPEGEEDFFQVNSSSIEGYGSAKELSLERAKVVQEWLLTQGVDEKRMDLKGWGGKKAIYDKKSEQADKNVRVEIEILKD